MKAIAGLVAALVLAFAGAAWAGDPDTDDDEWECTCTATCDGHDASTTVDVCADDDALAEAVSDGANSCARALAGQCTALGHCACTCHTTGDDC
jgi:hypothetical protein